MVPSVGTQYPLEKLSLLVVDEVASTLLPGLDHGGRHPLLASQITAAMQWILSIHRAGGPMDTLLDSIPAGQAEIRCSDREIEEGKPESDFPAAAGHVAIASGSESMNRFIMYLSTRV